MTQNNTFFFFKNILVFALLLVFQNSKAQNIFALTKTSQLIQFSATAPNNITTMTAVTGLLAGQNLVALDSRPRTGELYALGYNPTNATGRLYKLNPSTGALSPLGTADLMINLGANTDNIAMDFNPTVDRVRVLSTNRKNYRLHPDLGTIVATDTDLTYGVGDANAASMPQVGQIAYTNSYVSATKTTLYYLDEANSVFGTAFVATNPNNGQIKTIGNIGLTLNASDKTIDMDVAFEAQKNVIYLAANTTSGADQLYTINPMTGAATLVGDIGATAMEVIDIAVAIDRTIPALQGDLVYGLTTTAAPRLVSFDNKNPTVIRKDLPITGVKMGQTLVGMDIRPQDFKIYSLGYNTLGDTMATIYTLNDSTGIATIFADSVKMNLGATANIAFDFNPSANRLRIMSAATRTNYRLNIMTKPIKPIVDTVLTYKANDANFGKTAHVGSGAYLNSFDGATSTKLYDIDEKAGLFLLQNTPNGGFLNTLGSLGLVLDSLDYSVDMDVSPTKVGNTVENTIYLAANVLGGNNYDNLYTINPASGATQLVGRIGNGIGIRDIASKLTSIITVKIPSAAAPFGHLSNRLTLSARLQGSNEVPAVTTTANGVASFMLNATRDTMQVNIAFTGLKATAMHIHEGKAGANGGVFKDLTKNLTGNVARLMLTGADLSPANLKKFLTGAFYLNVHTAANPGGEIRGQIIVEDDKGYFADLNGAAQSPAVVTNATGSGVFSMDKSGQHLQFKVVAQGLSGAITSAHFHLGAAGSNGGVLLDVSSFIFGNTIIGTVALPASFAADVAAEKVYFNIHTAANPGGEIRGQLATYSGLQFDAKLDIQQLGNPAVFSQGQGVARLSLSPSMDTLSYRITTIDLTSAVTASHIHIGAPGMNGGVEFDLGAGTGNVISGTITGATLTKAAVNNLLSGNYYINVHTANNPATGEIRGQVYRLAREGYIAEVSGLQEVPANTSKAMGGGLVTIDRFLSSAHYMVAVDGLSGAVTSAHFHKAVKGSNGGVVYGLAATTGLYGYWSQATTPKFGAANEKAFRGDSIYVNFHTSANPGGEVRGQFARNYKISTTTVTKIIDAVLVKNFKAFPNPVQDLLTLQINVENAMTNQIIVVDILGRIVLQKEVYLTENQNEINLDLGNITTGTYILTFVNNGKITATTTLIKE